MMSRNCLWTVASESLDPLARLAVPYSLTWEPLGVYRRYFGDVSIAERRASFDAICGNARFDSLRFSITDYLEVANYEITDEATEEIAALHIAPLLTNPSIAIAAVATRPEVIDAIRDFKRYSFITAPYEIFATLDEARSWTRQQLAHGQHVTWSR